MICNVLDCFSHNNYFAAFFLFLHITLYTFGHLLLKRQAQ